MSFFGKKSKQVEEALADIAVMTRPATPAAVEPVPAAVVATFPNKPEALTVNPAMSEDAYARYSGIAEKVGFMVPEMLIEKFKLFMQKNNLPSYELKAVVSYMDALAKRDNPDGYGWQWKPLRKQDTEFNLLFGTPGSDADMWGLIDKKRIASDYFESQIYTGGGHMFSAAAYDKVVPMHALERVAMIEQEFGPGKIAFAVSDYATQPHIRPDPFLMAMIPNGKIGDGVGRFVIDVWDEPGFGILEMLK